MKVFAIVLALSLPPSYPQFWFVLEQARQSERREVPKGFSYPEASETVKASAPNSVRSLTGKVVDSNNAAMAGVLVERLAMGWGKRLHATFTNSDGLFSLPTGVSQIQYLKLSKPGFDTLMIRVRINKRSRTKLTLALNPSA
jgi:hypothetical protein